MAAAAAARGAPGAAIVSPCSTPGLEVPAAAALRSAEIERLDWSFATVDGAVNALLSSGSVVAAPREVVAAFVRDDVRKGPDGRFRFSFSPGAAVVAWSEMTLPAPPIAQVPTLVVRPRRPLYPTPWPGSPAIAEALGELLTMTTVPNGHNVLWESPSGDVEAIERFLASGDRSAPEALPRIRAIWPSAGFAVAVVEAVAAVELVAAGAAVEAVVAAFAVAAVLAVAHQAVVVAGAAPAAVAAVAGLAVVVAGPPTQSVLTGPEMQMSSPPSPMQRLRGEPCG